MATSDASPNTSYAISSASTATNSPANKRRSSSFRWVISPTTCFQYWNIGTVFGSTGGKALAPHSTCNIDPVFGYKPCVHCLNNLPGDKVSGTLPCRPQLKERERERDMFQIMDNDCFNFEMSTRFFCFVIKTCSKSKTWINQDRFKELPWKTNAFISKQWHL